MSVSEAQRLLPQHQPSMRERVLGLLRQYGANATSFQVLEPGFDYWFHDEDACVAYVDTGSAWVAAGAPICAGSRLREVANTFARAARASARRAVFFATEQRFVDVSGLDSMLIGEQPIFNPADWAENVRTTASLREQLRRARSKGVIVRDIEPGEVSAAGAPLRASIEALIARWMGTKPMPPMGFLVRIHPFLFAAERRLFVAMRGEDVVGFAGVVPIYARKGWFIEDLIRAPDAPNGTVELLVDAAMRSAAADDSQYLTLGLAPLTGAVEFWLHAARRYGSALYDFAGLRAFKAKFRPREWVPVYLSHPHEHSAYRATYDSLAAFAQGGLLRYGLETLLRGPDVVVRMLAFLLIPWTLGLASADGTRWFPERWVQWAWVTFDIALCAALFVLTSRRRRWLADLLAAFILMDASVTLGEAVLFNVPRARSATEYAVIGLAVAAPVVASIVLWNVRNRLARAG